MFKFNMRHTETRSKSWSKLKPSRKHVFNPFLANVHILYPLKKPKNPWFSGNFRDYEIGTLARNGLKLEIKIRN